MLRVREYRNPGCYFLGTALALVFTGSGLCQAISAGVKIGVPVTQYFDTGTAGSLHGTAVYSAATRRYTLGASFELRLTNAFGFEIDALYHRMGYTAIVNSFDSANGFFRNSAIDIKGNSWDFAFM